MPEFTEMPDEKKSVEESLIFHNPDRLAKDSIWSFERIDPIEGTGDLLSTRTCGS
jgi:hypothetical protein